jgi:phosphopantetheinyl transferase
MPLIIKEYTYSGISTILWHRIEPDAFFLDQVDIRKGKWEEVKKWSKERQVEWLCGRYMIQKFLGCSSRDLQIDKFGKPHLADESHFLSLSHSGHIIGLSFSQKQIGLDLQIKRPAISKIGHKYISDDEMQMATSRMSLIDAEHYLWCCKESIYKAYGRRQLDFILNIKMTDVANKGYNYRWYGDILKNGQILRYEISTRCIGDLYSATAVQIG